MLPSLGSVRIMSENTTKSTVDFPPPQRFEELGRILKWSELEQGGENIYHVRRYFENTKSQFDTKSIILELEKKDSPPFKVYCCGEVAKDICGKWDLMVEGQNMFLRPNGTRKSEAGYYYNVAHVVIQ